MPRKPNPVHYTKKNLAQTMIDTLFLDELNKNCHEILSSHNEDKILAMHAFHKKLCEITILDPACGDGVFLSLSYKALKAIENKILAQENYSEQYSLPRLSLSQFCGIEINADACASAIRHLKALSETSAPPRIECGDALACNWTEKFGKLCYIVGNPPFIGSRIMSRKQKEAVKKLFLFPAGDLDYACAWFAKSAQFMSHSPETRTAFLATNSICQGMIASLMWEELKNQYNIDIDFAKRDFPWEEESKHSSSNASVYCVITAFSLKKIGKEKFFLDNDNRKTPASHINAFLIDAPDFFPKISNKPICDAPPIFFGNMPADGGHLLLDEKEYGDLCEKYPKIQRYLRPFLGAKEFLHAKKRYCLWLFNTDVDKLKEIMANCPEIAELIQSCKAIRKKSSRSYLCEKPHLFAQISECGEKYVAIPAHSSQKRRYIPMDFVRNGSIASNALFVIPEAELWHFAVLSSSTHMTWVKAFAGRIKMDFRYSKDFIYHNFPWPSEVDIERLSRCAEQILISRSEHDLSLATLYDDMPESLSKAHFANDIAVWESYGKAWKFGDENDCLSCLQHQFDILRANRPKL